MNNDQIAQLDHLLDTNSRFVLTCHTNPDGDALGSTLGLRQVLLNMGKHVTIIAPDNAPSFYSWMNGFGSVRCYEREQEQCDEIIDQADVVFLLDFNDLSRIKSLGCKLSATPKALVMIDHHTDPQAQCQLTFSEPTAPATCDVVYRLLKKIGLEKHICQKAATHFYTGICTDTGGLSYNSSQPSLYRTVAELLEKNVDKNAVHDNVFNNKTLRRLKLLGFCLSRKMRRIGKLPITIMALNASELDRFHYSTGDTEGYVNYPLQMKDIKASVLILERPDAIKISLRSKGDFAVNEFAARYYSGGGHINAAGANCQGVFDIVVAEFIQNISLFFLEWSQTHEI